MKEFKTGDKVYFSFSPLNGASQEYRCGIIEGRGWGNIPYIIRVETRKQIDKIQTYSDRMFFTKEELIKSILEEIEEGLNFCEEAENED